MEIVASQYGSGCLMASSLPLGANAGGPVYWPPDDPRSPGLPLSRGFAASLGR